MEKCEPYSFASEIGPPVKYRLAVAIGAGGFGRVFRAFAVEAEGDSPGVYAVKRLPLRGTVNGKSEEEGFTNRDWQKLIQVSKHDNLVRYYAAHTACLDSDPQHFGHVVMELCEGMDLAGYLGSDEHRIDKKWIVLVACQVLKGMGHLHSFEVIHGDLKPANVFLVKTEHTVVAKIGDFDDRIKPASESETNDGIQGTAAYMSPEMMWTRIAKVDHVVDTACLHEITTKTDVWSFGCILFEMECRYRKMTDRFLTNENGTKGTGLDRSAETLYNYVVNYKCFPRVPDQSVPSLKRLLRACFAYDSKDRPAALELLNLSFLACKREKQHPPPPSVAEPPYLAPPTPAPSAMQFVSPAQAPESLSFKKLEDRRQDTSYNLIMPALGRPFTLGALYDCQTDSIVSGFSLWELDKLNANTVSTATPKTFSKVLKQDDVTHRANALSMKVSHRVDYLAGKCGQISGAATFLDHHPASITSNRVILHHSCTTETRALLVSNLSGSGMHSSDRVDSSRATHVVTSITYGAEAFFVFENKLGNAVFPDTKTPESMALQDAVNRLGVVKRQAAESHSAYDLPKLPQGSDIACHYFGDFKVGNTPRTYGDSARMIAEIPELLADKDNIVPKVVYLQPLSAFYSSASRQLFLEIDSVLMGQASTVLEYLNFVQHRSHDISENKVTAIFPEIRKIVDKFQDIVKQYHVSFTEKLIQHIQSIRFGASDPEPLKILLREHDASRFSKGVLGKWMEKRTLEVRWLMSLLDRLITQSETSAGAVKIVTSSAEFQMLLLNSKVKNYIYFQFQIMSKKDRFVRDLKLELGRILNCGNNDDSADPFMELPEYWFDNLSNVSFLTSRLNDFLDLAFANSGSTEFGFALCGTSTGDEFAPNATCKTLLYRTETNLFEAEEVALPLPPTISSVQKIDSFGNGPNGNRCSILVSCLGNVQRCPKTFNDAMKFMMYYRKYPVDQMDTAWSIANVEVTGPLLNLRATVNNLVPDQKYEFKVRSEGKLRTSFSKVHVIESLKNDSGILDKLGWKTVNVVRRKWKTYARLARDKKDFLNGIPMVTPQKAKRPAGVSNDRTQTKQVTGGQRSKKTPTQGNTTQERRQPTKNHEEPHGDWENVESSEDDEEDENDGRPDSGYAGNSASDYTYGTQYQSPQFYGDEDDDDDDDSDEDEDSDEDDDDERIAYMMAQMGQQHGGPNGFSAQNSRQVQRQMMAQQAYQAQQYGAISGNQQHYGGQFPDFGGRGRQTQYHGGQPRPRGHGSPGQQASYGGQYLPPGYPGSHY